MELSVGKLIAVENEEEAAAKAVQQNLKRKKAAALKKLHIDAVVQPFRALILTTIILQRTERLAISLQRKPWKTYIVNS